MVDIKEMLLALDKVLIGMAVYHRKPVFIVFCGYLSGRVGTEGADLVVKGGGIIYQLGFW